MSTEPKPLLDYWQERTMLAEEATMQLAQRLVQADPRLQPSLQGWANKWEALITELNQRHGIKEQP